MHYNAFYLRLNTQWAAAGEILHLQLANEGWDLGLLYAGWILLVMDFWEKILQINWKHVCNCLIVFTYEISTYVISL